MNKKINGVDIFAIPLFMPKDDWKILRLETSSDVLVEIFNKIGSIKRSISFDFL